MKLCEDVTQLEQEHDPFQMVLSVTVQSPSNDGCGRVLASTHPERNSIIVKLELWSGFNSLTMVLLVDLWWIQNYSTNWSVQRSDWDSLSGLVDDKCQVGHLMSVEWSEMIVTNTHFWKKSIATRSCAIFDKQALTSKLWQASFDKQALTSKLWQASFDKQALTSNALTCKFWQASFDKQALTSKLWHASFDKQALTSKSQQTGQPVPFSCWVCLLRRLEVLLVLLVLIVELFAVVVAQHWVSDCCGVFVFVWAILDFWRVHMMFILWGDCNPSNACWLLEVVFVWQNVVCDRIVRFSKLVIEFLGTCLWWIFVILVGMIDSGKWMRGL